MADHKDQHDPDQDEHEAVLVLLVGGVGCRPALTVGHAPVRGRGRTSPSRAGGHRLPAPLERDEDPHVAEDEDDERDDRGQDEAGPDLVEGREDRV